MLGVDRLYELLGKPGRYHVLIATTLLLNMWLVAFNHVIMAFYGAQTSHRCHWPRQNYNTSLMIENGAYFDRNESIRYRPDNMFANGTYGECYVYFNSTESNHSVKCPFGWDYDVEPGENTIVTEWDLVCERGFLSGLSSTIYFIGVLIGGLVFGQLADQYGRRPVVLISLLVPVLIGTGLAFVDHYIWFVVLRFIQGFFIQGLQSTNFILLTELFTPRMRTVVGNIQGFGYDVCMMVIALVNYLIRDWRNVQLAFTLPFMVMAFQFWALPESPRWLLVKRRQEETKTFFQRVAKFNHVELPDDVFIEEERELQKMVSHSSAQVKPDAQKKSYTILDLFRTPKLRKRTLIMFYISFTVFLVNYGLILGTSTFPGNKYFVFFLAGLVCSPNSFVNILLQRRFDRKHLVCVYLALTAVFCVAAGFVPKTASHGTNIQWLITTLAVLSRATIGSSCIITLVLMSEMFPTVVRNIGAGGCTTCMRIGAILASQAILLGEVTFTQFPFLIFGAAAGLGSILVLLLPELTDSHLPDTIQEVEESNFNDGLCKGWRMGRNTT